MNIQTRLSGENRPSLGEALPLEQPYVLLVDPSSICNLRCKWCPSGYDDKIAATGRAQQIMDFSMFERIVEQAGDYETPFRVLRLYKEGEPLINPSFPRMVELAKKSGHFKRVDTTTNGLLLSERLNREIVDAGLDQINISVNGVNEEQIYNNTGRHVDFKQYVNNIIDFCKNSGNCTVYVKSIKDILSEKEQQEFFDIFGEYADRVYLERLSPAWPAFDVNQSGYRFENVGNYEQPVENRKVCPYLFYIMVINSDGSVSTCVGDWKHLQVVGNIQNERIYNIWNGELQKKYQLQHLNGEKNTFEMCRNCLVITHGCYDNIDSYTDLIRKKLIQ